MERQTNEQPDIVQIIVEPGICGFPGSIRVHKVGRYAVKIELKSGCQQIKGLASILEEMTMAELFLPVTRNPVFKAAEIANCHPSCIYPVAILKAAEVALEMALPQEAIIRFRK
jgi:hypothetical protein